MNTTLACALQAEQCSASCWVGTAGQCSKPSSASGYTAPGGRIVTNRATPAAQVLPDLASSASAIAQPTQECELGYTALLTACWQDSASRAAWQSASPPLHTADTGAAPVVDCTLVATGVVPVV